MDMEPRRSLRNRTTRVWYEDEDHDDDDAGSSSSGDVGRRGRDDVPNRRSRGARGAVGEDEDVDDASEDEWRPEAGSMNKKRRRVGRRKHDKSNSSSDAEEEDEDSEEASVNEDDKDDRLPNKTKGKPVAKKIRKFVERGEAGQNLSAGAAAAQQHKSQKAKVKNSDTQVPQSASDHRRRPRSESTLATPTQVAENRPPSDDEDDGMDARAEADRLWKEVRARRAGGATQSQDPGQIQPSSTISTSAATKQGKASAGALDNWLGIDPPDWPTTCADAMINDRDSLFVGFVYALSSSSQNEITRCLSHLTKVVHPQAVPTSRFPPAMQHLAPNRRGSTHDMFAWRCLALKRGRTGLGGPEDFGLEEGQEDDGERFGAKEIAKVIRMYGATDVLVIVSRWYGGTMLGPVRFRHIEDCAKAVVGQHLVNEAMADLLKDLCGLDAEIAEVRANRAHPSGGSDGDGRAAQSPSGKTPRPSAYTDLDPERAQRLIVARRRQLEVLRRSQGRATIPQEPASNNQTPLAGRTKEAGQIPGEDHEAEEEAAIEAVAAVEEAAAVESAQAPSDTPGTLRPSFGTERHAADEPHVKEEPPVLADGRSASPRIAFKPDPEAEREPSPAPIAAPSLSPSSFPQQVPRVKPERGLSRSPTPALATVQLQPRVKDEENEDDTDLTGWDEIQ